MLQAFKVEMRELPREEAMAYDAKAKAFHNSLNKLHGDLQWAKTEGERGGLALRSVDDMTAGEIIQEAAKTQDQSLASVQRMKQQIADSKQVGAETAQKLKGQTEQLKNIDLDIMKVKSNLVTSCYAPSAADGDGQDRDGLHVPDLPRHHHHHRVQGDGRRGHRGHERSAHAGRDHGRLQQHQTKPTAALLEVVALCPVWVALWPPAPSSRGTHVRARR